MSKPFKTHVSFIPKKIDVTSAYTVVFPCRFNGLHFWDAEAG